MIRPASIYLAAALFICLAGRADGENGLWVPPLANSWEWGTPQPKGHVFKIIQGSQMADAKGNLSKPFMSEYRFSWESGRLKSVANGYVDFTTPFFTKTFDSKGRAFKLVYKGTFNNTPDVTSTEMANWNEGNELLSLNISRTNGERTTARVETQAIADGGKTLQWTSGEGRFKELVTLTLDKNGIISDTSLMMGETGKSVPKSTHLGYNDHGDLETFTNAKTNKTDRKYEYDYDAEGNWTKRSEYQLTGPHGETQKQLTAVYTRQITYSKGDTAMPQQEAEKAFGGSLIGTYKAQIVNGAFYSKMSLELKNDGTVGMANTMPDIKNRGQEMTNRGEGTWGRAKGTVVIILDKWNGEKVQAEDSKRTLVLNVIDDGSHLTIQDQDDLHFERQK